MTGPGGSSAYIYAFNVGAENVGGGNPVLFNGVFPGPGFVFAPGSITVLSTGVYRATFSLTVDEPNKFALEVNGVTQSVHGESGMSEQNTSDQILSLNANDQVSVVNVTPTASVNLSAAAGGAGLTYNATLVIQRLDA